MIEYVQKVFWLDKNKKTIDSTKAQQAIQTLRKIGWFSNHVLDKISEEVKK